MASNDPSNSVGRGNPVINFTAAELRRQREAEMRRSSFRRLQRVEEPSIPLPQAYSSGIILGENLSSAASLRNRMFSTNNTIHHHVNPNLLTHQARLNPNHSSLLLEGMNSQFLDTGFCRSCARVQGLENSIPAPPGIIFGDNLYSPTSLRNHIFLTNNIHNNPDHLAHRARLNLNDSLPTEGMNSQNLNAELSRSHVRLTNHRHWVPNDPRLLIPPPLGNSLPVSPTFPPRIILGDNSFSTQELRNHSFSTTTNTIGIGPNLPINQARPHHINDLSMTEVSITTTSKLRRQREAELDEPHTKLQRTEKSSISFPPTYPPGMTLKENKFSTNTIANIGPNLSIDQARPNISRPHPVEGMNSQYLDLQEVNNNKNVADDDSKSNVSR